MKKLFILAIVITAVVCSCDNRGLTNVMTDLRIAKELKKFDEKLVSHFPKNTDYEFGGFEVSNPDSSFEMKMGTYIIATYKIPGNDIDNLTKKLSEEAVKVCCQGDSCNIILPERHQSDNSIKQARVLPCGKDDELIPVPLFYGELYDLHLSTESFLPESYVFYVLGAESGKFIPETHLLKEGYMPAGWEHGYSKGVVVNKEKREAIYWIEIW